MYESAEDMRKDLNLKGYYLIDEATSTKSDSLASKYEHYFNDEMGHPNAHIIVRIPLNDFGSYYIYNYHSMEL